MKLAALLPAEIVTLVTCAAPLKNTPAVEVVASVTAWPPAPATTALPYVSSNCTVIAAEATPAVSVCAAVLKTSLVGRPN